MAKSSKSLTSMSVDALLKLRDDIGPALSHRATDLKLPTDLIKIDSALVIA